MTKRRAPKSKSKDPLHNADHGVRLNKYLAEAGVGSRRACDAIIEEHRVAVNGSVVTDMPIWVDPDSDTIEIDGHRIGKPRRGHTYLMVNKPRRVICSNSDEFGRRNVFDLVPHEERLFCVGRLDSDSTGLVLLTDDGPLANRLMHPRYEASKTYSVSIEGSLTQEEADKLKRGVMLANQKATRAVKARAEDVTIVRRDRERTRLRITLREGRNREIRRMLARLGHKVKRLQRTAIGPVILKGIASGEWRKLEAHEVTALRKMAKGSGK